MFVVSPSEKKGLFTKEFEIFCFGNQHFSLILTFFLLFSGIPRGGYNSSRIWPSKFVQKCCNIFQEGHFPHLREPEGRDPKHLFAIVSPDSPMLEFWIRPCSYQNAIGIGSFQPCQRTLDELYRFPSHQIIRDMQRTVQNVRALRGSVGGQGQKRTYHGVLC